MTTPQRDHGLQGRSPSALDQLITAVPLLGKVLDDPGVPIVARAIDNHWLYDAGATASTGWNPFRREIYIGRESLVAGLLGAPQADLREHNESDLLMSEAMFVVHDYLHIWAADTIRELRPELQFARAPLTADNLEDQVFALLITEAAATVGLDYWWLSAHPLSTQLDIGTSFDTLTVSYQERHQNEFRKFCPQLEAQEPGFFSLIARFYCDGVFPGFSVEDVRRSPRTLKWLRHELGYGASQRRYARMWLHHLAGLPVRKASTLARPLDAQVPWRTRLINELGHRLWELVKGPERFPVSPDFDPESTWQAPTNAAIDYRFTNALALAEADWVEDVRFRDVAPAEREFFIEQVLRSRRYPKGDLVAEAAIKGARKSDSCALAMWVARQLEPLDGPTDPTTQVRDMFFLK